MQCHKWTFRVLNMKLKYDIALEKNRWEIKLGEFKSDQKYFAK